MSVEQQQSAVLTPWRPSEDPSPGAITPRTVHRIVSAKYEDGAVLQRSALHKLRDRLQAAMFVGTHTDVVERTTGDDDLVLLREFEANKERYTTMETRESNQTSQHDFTVTGKCNVATASLLYRQFEMISRRGLAVEEMDERQSLMMQYWAQSRVVWNKEKSRAHRTLVSDLDGLKACALSHFGWSGEAITSLECSCRRRLESCADDSFSRLEQERRGLLASINLSQRIAREQRLLQQEENSRHVLAVEYEKGMSRLFVGEMNDAHSTQLSVLINASRAEQIRDASQARRATLLEPPDSDSDEPSNSSLVDAFTHVPNVYADPDKPPTDLPPPQVPSVATKLRKIPQPRAIKRVSEKPRAPPLATLSESHATPARGVAPRRVAPITVPPQANSTSNLVVPPPPATAPVARPQFMIDADVESNSDDEDDAIRAELLSHRQQLTNLTRFQQCYGWMLKSTGVFMTWQKRFFALTSKGKLRYTTTEPQAQTQQRWVTLINAEDIVRVELDTTCGAKPPIDQYHQYGFYVDCAYREGPKEIRQRRIRFCCYHRSDLQMWLAALRHATDVVFALEERGDLPRSPLRRLLDPAVLTTLLDSEPVRHYSLRSPVPQTYRLRMQAENEAAAIEEHLKEVDAAARAKQQERELTAALRSYSPTRFDA